MRVCLVLAVALAALPARADPERAFQHSAAVVEQPAALALEAAGASMTQPGVVFVPVRLRAGVLPGLELQLGGDLAGVSWPAVTQPSPPLFRPPAPLFAHQGTLSRVGGGAMLSLFRRERVALSLAGQADFPTGRDPFYAVLSAGIVGAVQADDWVVELQALAANHVMDHNQDLMPEGWLRASWAAAFLVPSFALEVDSVPEARTFNVFNSTMEAYRVRSVFYGVPAIAAYLDDSVRVDFAVPGNPFGDKPWGLRLGLRVDVD